MKGECGGESVVWRERCVERALREERACVKKELKKRQGKRSQILYLVWLLISGHHPAANHPSYNPQKYHNHLLLGFRVFVSLRPT